MGSQYETVMVVRMEGGWRVDRQLETFGIFASKGCNARLMYILLSGCSIKGISLEYSHLPINIYDDASSRLWNGIQEIEMGEARAFSPWPKPGR